MWDRSEHSIFLSLSQNRNFFATAIENRFNNKLFSDHIDYENLQ